MRCHGHRWAYLVGPLLALSFLAGCQMLPGASKEAYPTRPVTLVVGFAPGGGADVFARALAEAAKTTLPQPIVVENRAGAGGTTSTAYVLERPADGYTILFGHAGSTILTPLISKSANLKWDAVEPVTRIHGEEEFLFLRPDSQWKTIDEVVKFAKENPGKFRVGGSAVGGVDSFVILALKKAAGIDVTYVPFDGGGPAALSFLGGNVDMLVGNVSENMANIEAKKMMPIAVASEKRSSIADVPTLKEKGWDVVLVQWRGIFAPKGTPPERVRTLSEGLQKALNTDSWKGFRTQSQSVDLFLGPADFRTFLAAEEGRFGPMIQELGL